MTPTELKAIRERCEKATPGPWTWHSQNEGYYEVLNGPLEYPDVDYACIDSSLVLTDGSASGEYTKKITSDSPNGIFIAHARTDIPRLLDEVERLRLALKYYADEDNYLKAGVDVFGDTYYSIYENGGQAREALKELSSDDIKP